MKAYVLKGVGQLEYIDVPVPALKPGWVLVAVSAAGICGSDLPRIFRTGTYHFPTIPGHEFAGTVVEVYDEEDAAWIGKRVGVFPLIPCMECFVCREGHYEMCRHYNYLGSRCDGGFAQFAAVPVWNLIELPENMSMEEAAMLEPASVALHAIRRLKIRPKDTVALYGLGTIGLIVTQWLHVFGITDVYAVGHNPGHGSRMKETASPDYRYFNADASCDAVSKIMEQTDGRGVDLAIDCAGATETLANCLNCVKPGGQILLIGNPAGDMVFDKASYWKILRNQIRLTGTWNSSFCHSPEDDWHKTIEACAAKKLNLSDLITHRLSFEELHRGLDIAKERLEYHNKIMICNMQGQP